jgi:elongation factor Ts
MSPVSAAAVSSLRARTGVPMLAVKQALEEANGNEELAIEILRKRGIAQAVKKADRAQSEGALFVAEDGKKAAIVGLKCETDFVGRSDAFLALGKELAELALKSGPDALMKQAEPKLAEAVQKLGENISLGEVQEIVAPALASYVHSNRKIAVVVGADGGEVAKLKDVAMHAAALNPLYVRPDEVSGETIEKEREIWKEQLSKEKKPEAILQKIMEGKEKKFREENALLTQPFVKDSNQTVEKYLGGAKVTAYVRVTV